jgi:hypothetical protein
MIQHLYTLLNQDATRDQFTGNCGVCFLEQKSFEAKLDQHAQDFQSAYMITKHFFLPVLQVKEMTLNSG